MVTGIRTEYLLIIVVFVPTARHTIVIDFFIMVLTKRSLLFETSDLFYTPELFCSVAVKLYFRRNAWGLLILH